MSDTDRNEFIGLVGHLEAGRALNADELRRYLCLVGRAILRNPEVLALVEGAVTKDERVAARQGE
jgi:hypothetical protein